MLTARIQIHMSGPRDLYSGIVESFWSSTCSVS